MAILWVLACTLVWLVVSPPARAENRALLIGIDDYQHVQPLVGSVNDVRDMERFTRESWGYRPHQIKLLLNKEATRAAILAAISTWLVEGTSPGDDVFLYYSGHGYQQPDSDGDEEDGLDETLVPVDTSVSSDGVFRNMISDDEIGALLDRIPDRNATIMIDSCHSGTVTRELAADLGGKMDPRYVRTPRVPVGSLRGRSLTRNAIRKHRQEESFIQGKKNRIVWTAVSSAQKALVDQEIQRPGGVFTQLFLRGLELGIADANSNGVVSHAELLDFLQTESEAYCNRHKAICRFGLTPTLEAEKSIFVEAVIGRSQAASSTVEIATNALAHGNNAGVRLELLPTDRVNVGQFVSFKVTSKRDGYLVLLDIDAEGRLTQIFPNRFSDTAGTDNRIHAGRPIIVPDAHYGFKLEAEPPTGKGVVLAVVTEDPVPLESLLGQHKDLQVVANPSGYLADLAQRLRATWHADRENRRLRWSMAERDYEIIR